MYLYIGCNGSVAAVDPKTGDEVWRAPVVKGLLGGSVQQDVCILEDGGRVFAGCYGEIVALDAGTGEELWRNSLKGMGYNEVTLAMAGKSVQYVSSHTHTHTST